MFFWTAEVIGGIGSLLDFTANAKAQVEGCTGSSFIDSADTTVTIKIVPGVRREIIQKPELFITIPNPFGDIAGGEEGTFAIAVSNPTDESFDIHQVSVQLVTPTGGDIVSGSTAVLPSTGTWADTANVAFWTENGGPITLGAFNTTQFSVTLGPTVSASTESTINTAFFNIYTSFGQFSKGPFTFGTYAATTAIAAVFMDEDFTSPGTPVYAVTSIVSGKQDQKFNVTITNEGDDHIDSGAKLIINLPARFLDVKGFAVFTGDDLDLSSAVATAFDDGSTQVVVTTDDEITSGETATFQFTADIPSVSTIALFTFTIVGDGTALTTGSSTSLLGPISEVIIQVCPDDGGGKPDCT